jgi:flavin-dependent dehydrogenase
MKRAKFEKRSQCDRLGINSHADRRHAIVIGGSIAGLLTARILSDHFSQVTLIERDRFSDRAAARKSQPHAQHSHALLTQGKEILHHYFPSMRVE